MAESMVEKVARAMASAESGPVGSVLFSIHWDEFGAGYLDSARAAIEAMRDPTDAMVDAAGGELVPCGDFIPAYRAAILAALNEEVAG